MQPVLHYTMIYDMHLLTWAGQGNHGLTLSVDNADPESAISPESQDLIRDVMAKQLDGRFEYQLLRGMGAFRQRLWRLLTA